MDVHFSTFNLKMILRVIIGFVSDSSCQKVTNPTNLKIGGKFVFLYKKKT